MSVWAFWKVIANLFLTRQRFEQKHCRMSYTSKLVRVSVLLKPWVMLALANIKSMQAQNHGAARVDVMGFFASVLGHTDLSPFVRLQQRTICMASGAETRDRNMEDWLGEGQQLEKDVETGTEKNKDRWESWTGSVGMFFREVRS